MSALDAAYDERRETGPLESCLGIVGLRLAEGTWSEFDFIEVRVVEVRANIHELQRAISDGVVATVLSRYSSYVAHELVIREGLATGDDAPILGLRFADLLRIQSGPEILIPGALDASWCARTMNRLAERTCRGQLLEDYPNSISIDGGAAASHDQLRWTLEHLTIFSQLYTTRDTFALAVDAFCRHIQQSTKRMSAAMLWSGVEALFGTRGNETTYRLAIYVASYLEPPGIARLELFRKIKDLYNTRSRLIHGNTTATVDLDAHLRETRILLQRLLQRMIIDNEVPTSERFDELVLAPDASEEQIR